MFTLHARLKDVYWCTWTYCVSVLQLFWCTIQWRHNEIMRTMASQITSLTIVYATLYSDAEERKHQSSASLAFVRGIHRWLVNSPHKGPVTRKMFPFDDVIMTIYAMSTFWEIPAACLDILVSTVETPFTSSNANWNLYLSKQPNKTRMLMRISVV